MKLRQELKLIVRPMDMVPMVTVILLLLFFFLLCSTLILQPGIKVKVSLPSTSVAGYLPQTRLIVTVGMLDRDDTKTVIYMNDEKIDGTESLKLALRKEAEKDSSQTVLLRADERLSQAAVLEVMSAILSTGLPVVIGTQEASEKKP
ncbi:biopolymer transporter ExbD [Oscillatoria laete-virens NRMC-F 0139]|nr:biopolymer transporter ExbD [Oscillatoria laete-virens]MDL5053182.1 biopolymer transporter ExbD [Oscillatoria laete-virens NRMC-F 0139]